MDWGCASGRMLRFFLEEAREGEFWGVDIDITHLDWAKDYLPQSFKFVNCTTIPSLPFEDNYFTLIYARSVFTHIGKFADMWLMELKRVLKPGGYILATVCDEESWKWYMENTEPFSDYLSSIGFKKEDFEKEMDADVFVQGSGPSCLVFYKRDYLRRTWGNLINIREFRTPFPNTPQTLLVMQK